MTPILADAHVRSSVQNSLEQKGIEVLRVQDRLESDATDSQILDYAGKEDLAILTNDSDFEKLAEEHDHAGIIFITSQYARRDKLVAEIIRTVDQLTREDIRNSKIYVP